MKARIQNRIDAVSHTVLGEVLPLETPFVLLVDPSNRCNLRCRFCPTGDRTLIRKTGRWQGDIDLDLFKKIIDDIKAFAHPIKVLRLYKEGEPLLNPYFPDMVAYARASQKVVRIDTTTNGLLLNPDLNRKIIAAGLDRINISVNGVSGDQIRTYTHARVDFEKYCANIRDLYEHKGDCEIYVKAIRDNLAPDEQERFFAVFGDMSDRIFLENLSPAWPAFRFDGIEMKFSAGHYGQPIVPRKVCPYIFYIMVINSDGTTSLCVGDWKHILSYGNVRTASVRDTWLGDRINVHRIAHLEGRRSDNEFCAGCQVVSHGTLENIDAYAEAIRKRLK